MVVRRRYPMRRRRVRRPRGRGFMDAIRSAHDWIKKNRIISTVGSALGKVGVPYAGAIGTAASALGYGRRRRVGRPRIRRRVVRRRRVGGSLRGILSAAHGFVKKHQLVSKGLNHFGHSRLAAAASSLGYGRRRRVRRHRGGAMFTTEQIAMHRLIK